MMYRPDAICETDVHVSTLLPKSDPYQSTDVICETCQTDVIPEDPLYCIIASN